MSARILQVDLSAALQAISAGGGTLLLLVKMGLQPLGWLKVKAGPDGLSADQLSQLISQALPLQLHDAARQRLFEPRNPGADLTGDEIRTFAGDHITLDPNFRLVLSEDFSDPSVQCVVGDIWPSFDDAIALDRSFIPRRVTPTTWNAMFARKRGAGEPRVALSIRRGVFDALGEFDPALRGEAARIDLVTRILRGGGVVIHDPRALGFKRGYVRRDDFRDAFDFAAYCSKYFRDAELANLSFKAWRSLLGQSLGSLDLSSAAGAILGVREYRRARRRLRRSGAGKAA